MMPGRAVLWTDGCFEIEDDDSSYWVTETLHASEGSVVKEDVPKRWRIRFETPDSARQWIGARLRDSHDSMYHFHTQQAVGQ